MTIARPVTAKLKKTRGRTPLLGISASLNKFWWHSRAYLTIFWVMGLATASLLFLYLYRAIDFPSRIPAKRRSLLEGHHIPD